VAADLTAGGPTVVEVFQYRLVAFGSTLGRLLQLSPSPTTAMNPKSRRRKAFTIIGALVAAGVVLALGREVVVMSGTKATFSFVNTKAAPGGSSTTTSTSKSSGSTTKTGATTSTPAAGTP
jgi:hypothetical protein